MIYLKNAIDFREAAEDMNQHFPSSSIDEIKKSFEQFFWADERSDFWYYSGEQAQAELEIIKAEFIAESAGESREIGAVALFCKMELIGNPEAIGSQGWGI